MDCDLILLFLDNFRESQKKPSTKTFRFRVGFFERINLKAFIQKWQNLIPLQKGTFLGATRGSGSNMHLNI
jgi:hypothetical protein